MERAPLLKGQRVIELEEALEMTAAVGSRLTVETVPLERALGRVLARTVVSPIDSPPFDKSSMDGFAVMGDESSTRLRIVDVLAAGGEPRAQVRAGECARIMTGAMLPPGAGKVIRKELVEESDGFIVVRAPETSDNVIPRGANLRAGDVVLAPKRLAPQDIGILAACGVANVEVAVPPRVAVLSTGSELRSPGEALAVAEIYDSNAAQLTAQVSAMGCPCLALGKVADDRQALTREIRAALERCDVLLLSGGVSVGDFDFVPGCLTELGAKILFHGVSIKPGKPVLFAAARERFVFGMPGNPVSAFVIFEVIVKPFLYQRMGLSWEQPVFRGRLASRIERRSVERTEFLPVRARGGQVQPIPYHGSAHLNALADADGLIRVPKGTAVLQEGDEVDVRPV